MDEFEFVCEHQLTVNFLQDRDGNVHWVIQADDVVAGIREYDNVTLARAGAPLATLGLKVLRELIEEQVLKLALDRADRFLARAQLARRRETGEPQPDAGKKAPARQLH